MKSDELMTIGRFARLSGVSVHALRHDVGRLVPAHVDASSGYRRYGASQLRLARLIRALRWADLPIDGIRQILNDIGVRASASSTSERSQPGDAAPSTPRHRGHAAELSRGRSIRQLGRSGAGLSRRLTDRELELTSTKQAMRPSLVVLPPDGPVVAE